MTTDTTPHWVDEFEHYKQAFTLLRDAVEISQERTLSSLEKDGLVRRFRKALGLGFQALQAHKVWNRTTLSYCSSFATVVAEYTPLLTAREATWASMHEARDNISLYSNLPTSDQLISDIQHNYFIALNDLFYQVTIYLLLV